MSLYSRFPNRRRIFSSTLGAVLHEVITHFSSVVMTTTPLYSMRRAFLRPGVASPCFRHACTSFQSTLRSFARDSEWLVLTNETHEVHTDGAFFGRSSCAPRSLSARSAIQEPENGVQ